MLFRKNFREGSTKPLSPPQNAHTFFGEAAYSQEQFLENVAESEKVWVWDNGLDGSQRKKNGKSQTFGNTVVQSIERRGE